MSGATGQTMPNAHAASVSYSKVYDYLLNPMHPDNSGKAQFFVGFGFTSLRWDILRDALHPSFTVPFHKQLKGRDNSPACDGVALHVPYWQLSAEYC